jgi:HTH-type transcriptional repressor of NAD biosynthesis genes
LNVAGKFAPLHRGHQRRIEAALRESGRVTIAVVPAPETPVPLSVRAGWLRALYPQAEVVEAWQGCADEVATDEDAAIRNDPYAHRHLIDPLVYRDLIARVAFLGAMSTGKTTVCTALAERYRTVWMPEYGREYWEQHHVERRLTLAELVHIADEHRRREDEMVLEANRILLVDTEAIVTRLFSVYYHGRADERLERFADEVRDRYDLFFLCDDDIPYADTPDRSGEANRALFQMWLRDELARRKIPYVTLRGGLEERVARAAQVIDGYEKYRNVGDWLL